MVIQPGKFAGQDVLPTFICLRLPVDAQPLLASAGELIEESNLLHRNGSYWHKADKAGRLPFVRFRG